MICESSISRNKNKVLAISLLVGYYTSKKETPNCITKMEVKK